MYVASTVFLSGGKSNDPSNRCKSEQGQECSASRHDFARVLKEIWDKKYLILDRIVNHMLCKRKKNVFKNKQYYIFAHLKKFY